MISTPDHWWLTVALAAALAGDALLSIRPPQFIQQCLEGVRFPRDWWWTLVVIKLAAAGGLLLGLRYDGVAATTNAAVIGYFLCAAYAHVRARFVGSEFWLNCLGMLGFSTLVLAVSYA